MVKADFKIQTIAAERRLSICLLLQTLATLILRIFIFNFQISIGTGVSFEESVRVKFGQLVAEITPFILRYKKGL